MLSNDAVCRLHSYLTEKILIVYFYCVFVKAWPTKDHKLATRSRNRKNGFEDSNAAYFR